MSRTSVWSVTNAVNAEQSNVPAAQSLQEIMDYELAMRIHENESRAPEEARVIGPDFAELLPMQSTRELFNADSVFDWTDEREQVGVDGEVDSCGGMTKTSTAIPAKPRFDRSTPVEGHTLGLNSIRESFRRQDKQNRRESGNGVAGRVETSKFATRDSVLDERTARLLQKLINRGDLDAVHGCVQSGKEANVYYAVGRDEQTLRACHYAVKVFKTALAAFSNRHEYVTGDRRFDFAFQKKDTRRQLHEWSEKEYRNLCRASACPGVRAPTPLLVKEHVVVMRFVGSSDGWPAATLKEAKLRGKQLVHAYVELLAAVRALFQQARLVHGDLSEYNVLYHAQQCWLIDFGQAVDRSHPQALALLRRDLLHLHTFVAKRCLDDATSDEAGAMPVEDMLAFVTSEDGSCAALADSPPLQQLLRRTRM